LGTFIAVITNIATVVSTLAIMISLEWRLTVLSVIILPLFIIPTHRVGRILREIRRESMDANAKMNSLMNETLNVSGVLLVKLFGRQREEKDKLQERSGKVAYLGVRSAMIGRWFFTVVGERGYRLSGGEKQRIAITGRIPMVAAGLLPEIAGWFHGQGKYW
jgi:ATP-binding cassette subfamily B protein